MKKKTNEKKNEVHIFDIKIVSFEGFLRVETRVRALGSLAG